MVHPIKSLILTFEEMFPLYKNASNIYKDHGTNCIMIQTPMKPIMIFRYENKSKWELMTLESDEAYMLKLTDLRNALTFAQTQIRNLKRRK